MNILIIGCPGSGKDTLADKLKSQYHYTIITPGEIFRQEAAKKTILGLHARDEYWSKGRLCPDNIVNSLIKNVVTDLPEVTNIIFNGYPRSINQADFLRNIAQIHMVLELTVTEDIATDRLLRRGRGDDKENIIRHRFKEFRAKTEPVMDFYKNMDGCSYISIDATKEPQIVFEEAFCMILENATY